MYKAHDNEMPPRSELTSQMLIILQCCWIGFYKDGMDGRVTLGESLDIKKAIMYKAHNNKVPPML